MSRSIVKFRQTDNTAGVNTTAGDDLGHTRRWTINSSTANSVNEIYAPAALTIPANTTNTIDLSNSTVNKNAVNAALTFARTKFIYIKVAQESGHVNGVLVNGLAANSCTDLYKVIPAGGHVEFSDPSAAGTLVNSTSKNLVLTNRDVTNSINVTIAVVGGRT
jgi:hypothetical protein